MLAIRPNEIPVSPLRLLGAAVGRAALRLDPVRPRARSQQWPSAGQSQKTYPMKNMDSRNVPALVYEGDVINARAEMLSLTDMWRAAKSDHARQPSNWLASADAKRFIETLDILEPGNSGVQTKRGGRGVGGSTFAHWQIALAYAKYLSPAFHMWCNTVVRERMEGRSIPTDAIPAEILEMIRRTDGISRMLSHKVTEIEKSIPSLVSEKIEAAIAADARRAVLDYVSVRQLLNEAKAEQKGRKSLNRRCGYRLALIARKDGGARHCPHTNVWLYPRSLADKFMREEGAALVKAHNDAVRGQGVLKLVSSTGATASP